MSEVKGNIKVINATQVISEKFSKREFVVTTNDMYPQEILIQLTQDKVSLLDSFKVGDNVNVSINLRGRVWTNKVGVDKYFNTIEGWKIDKDSAIGEQSPESVTAEKDDLPF